MIRRVVQLQPEKPADMPQTFERRAYVRYSRRLESFWQFLGVKSAEQPAADVSDLSMTGLRLVVEVEFVKDAILMLRLPTATLGWTTHLARVKHCQRQDDGRYQVGCAFVRPLSLAQLQSLLV